MCDSRSGSEIVVSASYFQSARTPQDSAGRANHRLKKTNGAHRRAEIGIGRGEISIAFDGRKPVQMPADGSTIRWTREDSETFDVNAAWDRDRLAQTLRAADGTRANALSVVANGGLNILVTLTTPQLDQPLVYTLTFSRAGT